MAAESTSGNSVEKQIRKGEDYKTPVFNKARYLHDIWSRHALEHNILCTTVIDDLHTIFRKGNS